MSPGGSRRGDDFDLAASNAVRAVNATLDHFGLTGEEAVVNFVESTKGDIVEG